MKIELQVYPSHPGLLLQERNITSGTHTSSLNLQVSDEIQLSIHSCKYHLRGCLRHLLGTGRCDTGFTRDQHPSEKVAGGQEEYPGGPKWLCIFTKITDSTLKVGATWQIGTTSLGCACTAQYLQLELFESDALGLPTHLCPRDKPREERGRSWTSWG